MLCRVAYRTLKCFYGGFNVIENLLYRLQTVGSHVCDSLITRVLPLHEGLRNAAFTNLHMWELLALLSILTRPTAF